MEDLLANQEQVGKAMEQLLSSFKKTARDRRTPDYIRRKLETLDAYWKEFQSNHSRLCQFEDEDIAYFQHNQFEQAMDFYTHAKAQIQQSLPSSFVPETHKDSKVSSTPVPVQPGTSSTLGNPERKTQACDSKTTELLKRQASNFKAFTRTVNNIDLEAVTEKWEFEDLLKELQSRWAVIDTLHWQLDSELEGDNEQYEIAFSSHEKTYIFMKRAINSKLWSTTHREKSTPKMEIPTFHGNYYQWISFKDLFTEAIHSNPLLSNAQKMQFLKSKVKGEAEKLIQHLQISADNYQVCWDILHQRYQNKRLIFTSHVSNMLNLPSIQQPNVSQIKRLHDTTNECLNSIKNLGVDVSTWDPLLVHILLQKLDSDTHRDYMESLKQPRELPTLKEFLDFLELKFTTLESSIVRKKQDLPQKTNNIPSSHNSQVQRFQKSSQFKAFASSKTGENINQVMSRKSNLYTRKLNKTCVICSDEHGIYHCKQFLCMPADAKLSIIMKHNLCKNCLFDHKGKNCLSNKTCQECNGRHNTILHEACVNETRPSTSSHNSQAASETKHQATYVSQSQQESTSEVLISTAMLQVQATDGTYHKMRALVDPCSQITLITNNAARNLKLVTQQCKAIVAGVGEKANRCKGIVTLNCSSLYQPASKFQFIVDAYVMDKLVKALPSSTFKKQHWPHLEGLELADTEFNVSRPVDIILGSDIYSSIILDGLRKGSPSMPVAQQTELGWIICGSTESTGEPRRRCYVINFQDEVKRFWEVEDISEDISISAEDKYCLDYFRQTTRRNKDGRFVVRLPLNQESLEQLGSSKSTALAQFRQLERRFSKNKEIEHEYKTFMREYIELSHMKPSITQSPIEYYLPHHPVIRANSSTTKLRVVFNASAKSLSGHSLNDMSYKGPNLQRDLQQLMLSWRQFQFVYTADIEKMYRQIMVHEDDQAYQKIFWRESDCKKLQTYQLATVTYGTKPAPFLAMMCLQQLASDEKLRYHAAAKALTDCFYMDDYCGGSHTLSGAIQIRDELVQLLKSAGFNLRKWTSNEPFLLSGLSQDQCNQKTFEFKHVESTKTLGLGWHPKGDKFIFQCTLSTSNKTSTKRSLLSDISKLFDPLGWLTPLSINMKLLFQKVWLSRLDWDDELPTDIQHSWTCLRHELSDINTFEIKRWLGTTEHDYVELHGFCDASHKAYACVIYSKVHRNGRTIISLLAAKARLAPINKTLSTPRLELMGAQLLSKLMCKVQQSLSSQHLDVFGWIDSTAVLGWLHGDPSRWKPFVANRVKAITTVMPSTCWQYIKTNENPADCASRGLSVAKLRNYNLWWTGPSWLSSFGKQQGSSPVYTTNLEVKASVKQAHTVIRNRTETNVINDIVNHLFNKHNCITKITRILAWILRLPKHNKQVHQPYITLQEMRHAKLLIIKNVQSQEFADDIISLQKHQNLPSKSVLLNLKPILDKEGILRVGGRLQNATIGFEMKHPIIIPHESRLTTLLIQQAHKLTFHGGARITLANLRQKFWIIGGNRATKKHIRRCVTCRKHNPILQHQLMGDLPASRVNPEKAFYFVGVDYTGYVDVKASKGRGIKTSKGYISIFVCMVTKAVHLELVSDLTSSAFLAALSRMVSRRGAPRHIFSDNGTNFVGANRLLQEAFNQLKQTQHSCLQEISSMGIEWHFNAPSWPNAGGLWERAVRSLKHHLKRVIGEQKLTYEEYATLLAKVEACLNSRPLSALTEDPDDLDFLTPSHFLAARPGLTIIETELDARTRWSLISKLFEDLWKRWKTEYLTQLSVRAKWLKPHVNISLGDLVTIQDDNLPPGKWMMGRVIELHPGHDGLVRVVSLKTRNGIIKRPTAKLSVLPLRYRSEERKQQACDKNEGNSQNEPATNIIKYRSTKPGTFTSLAMSLIFFMSLFMTSNGAYNISALPRNTSLYLDPVEDMQIIRDKWTLVVYYDMSPYWEGTTAAIKFLNYSEKICSCLVNKDHCSIILLQLQHEFEELKHYNDLLLNQHFDARSRQRRGLVNGIGYVANSLFGVLDEHFAEQYKRDIELTRQHEGHIVKLIRNQTSIIEAQYNLLKRTENAILLQHKTINRHLIELDHAFSNLSERVASLTETQDFTLSAMTTSNLLQNLKRIQDTLLDTITDIFHGKLNTHLLTPGQLRNELQFISSQLTRDISLPLDALQSDLKYIYNMLRIKARILKDYFIFEITFPLTSRETYKIHRSIPVPHQIARDMITVISMDEYIVVNVEKGAFFTLSTVDMQGCLYNERIYLCEISKPIHYLALDETFCEINSNTQQCALTKSACKNRWVELNDPSKYLYFCCNSYSVRILCHDHVAFEPLSGAGIISLGSTCVIKGKEFSLYPRSKSANIMKFGAEVVTPKLSQLDHIMLNISFTQYTDTAYDSANETLADLGNQIKQLKEATSNTSDEISTHDVHQYVISYGLLIVAVAVAGVFLWRRKQGSAEVSTVVSVPSELPIVQCSCVSNQADVQPRQVPSVVISRSDESSVVISHSDEPSAEYSEPNSACSSKLKTVATSPIPKKCIFVKDLP